MVGLALLTSCDKSTTTVVTTTLTTTTGETTLASKDLPVQIASQTFTYDGEAKSLAYTGTLPTGYTATFSENNSESEVGRYKVSLDVKDAEGKYIGSSRAILAIEYPENEEFEKLLDELLIWMFDGDQMSINFVFVHPENFGITHEEAEMYTASTSEDEYKEMIDGLAIKKAELEAFKDAHLSVAEIDAYETISDLFEYYSYVTYDMTFMTNDYLGTYLGYQSNWPVSFSEYHLRNEQDVKDMINIAKTTLTAFKTYLNFASEMDTRGYGMADSVIAAVKDQCVKFVTVESGKKQWLEEYMENKINACTFLSDTEKASYVSEFDEAFVTVMASYQLIVDNIDSLKGKSKLGSVGLASYGEAGKTYYKAMLANTLGYDYDDLNIDDLFSQLEIAFVKNLKSLSTTYSNGLRLTGDQKKSFDAITADKPTKAIFSGTQDQIIGYLKEAAKVFVPDLPVDPEISISLIDESLEDSFSPACYFLSPYDLTDHEQIYFNPKYTSDISYVFTTTAHEGYPGHLYNTVYTKSLTRHPILYCMRCSGFQEGWATYSEYESYNWSNLDLSDKGNLYGITYLKQNGLWSTYFATCADMGINYYGWSLSDFTSWLNEKTGNEYSDSQLDNAYRQIAETSTNQSMYGISYYLLSTWRTSTQSRLGSNFNIIDYNTVYLNNGFRGLQYVEAAVKQYTDEQTFIYGC